jgi:hypothetical protein
MRFPFAFALILPSMVSSPNCDDLFDFLLENELCSIDFPPYGYFCSESEISLQDECEDNIHWWMGVDRECCYARQPLGPWRTKPGTAPLSAHPTASITAHPTAHATAYITSTSSSAQRQTTSPKDISMSGIALAGSLSIYPAKTKSSKKFHERFKKFGAVTQFCFQRNPQGYSLCAMSDSDMRIRSLFRRSEEERAYWE